MKKAVFTAILVLFNGVSAFIYASALLALTAPEWRLHSQLRALASPGSWDYREAALVAAALAGASLTHYLLRSFRGFVFKTGRWLGVAAAIGAGFGCLAVVLACALTPGVLGLRSLAASPLSPRNIGRLVLAPIFVAIAAPAGVMVSPFFLMQSLPVVLPGGALNGVVCFVALRLYVDRKVGT